MAISAAMRGVALAAVLTAMGAAGGAVAQPARGPDPTQPVWDRSIADIQAEMAAGRITSEALVRVYLDRIAELDRAGPGLHAVLALNPTALADARALDDERRSSGARGPLHGVPILIKDSIETLDPVPTTAGSEALAGNLTLKDAFLVARLRAAGAVILGKANLSEWSNHRSTHAISGWSALGGLTRNPYVLDRSACGSSSGSAVGVAAGLAAGAVGAETDGSIVCPSAMNGVAGLKPTLGLVSRARMIPIGHSQDTAGPIGRNVSDLAVLLTAMAGGDPADPVTAGAGGHVQDYTKALRLDGLRGRRIGVLRFEAGRRPEVDAAFGAALAVLRAAGATLVEVALPDGGRIGKAEGLVLDTEFHAEIDAYLAKAPAAVGPRSLADLIAFNAGHPRELALFGQEGFEQSARTAPVSDAAYLAAREQAGRLAGPEGLDRVLAASRLDALVAPTTGAAWRIDTVEGDHFPGSFSGFPAVAGYPHLTVPMGFYRDLPLGISFIGTAWSEPSLLAMGYAYEQRAHARRPPLFLPTEAGE